MGSFHNYALAGILAIAASTTARAADLLPPPPMPYAHAPVEVGGGWYLRGDIGMTNQSVDRLSFGADDADYELIHHDFDSSPLVGLGIGYQFNSWIRADVTGEYRGKSTFHGFERPINAADRLAFGTNEFRATKSEWVGLVNAYFDLGTWMGITPFIGAGVGFAHNTIDNYLDINTTSPEPNVQFAKDESKTNLAWAVHAGLGYDVTQNFKVEVAYRYLNLGDAETPKTQSFAQNTATGRPAKFKEIDSHDVKIGMRWMLGGPVMAASNAPVIRKY
jgi:opacity protein-like surface antigen